MTNARLDAGGIATLRAQFSGALLLPDDAGYDDARRIHNGLIDRRPALIARCLGTADVVAAVRFARERGLALSVRGGGHNVAGKAVADGAVMVDLSLMKAVHVDPDTRTARAQGGVLWKEFNRETALHGLATTGGVISTTGIAGLTLGGGLGWLMARHGLALDNLVAAEVVTASGDVLRASDRDHPDLFWAIRGAGPNFGVVPWLEYRLHPLREVTGGLVAHPIALAHDVLHRYRDATRDLPDDETLVAGLLHAPDGSGNQVAAILACHCGALPDGEAALRPLKAYGSPLVDTIGPTSYEAINTMLDAGFPRGALSYWKSSFVTELGDPVIETLIAQFHKCPSPMSGLIIEHVHGAMARVGPSDTAFPHRRDGYNVLVAASWLDARDSERNIAWTRDTYAALGPYFAPARYVNYLGDDEEGDPVRAAYGPNYARLQALKSRYDPENFFRLNQNIPPAR